MLIFTTAHISNIDCVIIAVLASILGFGVSIGFMQQLVIRMGVIEREQGRDTDLWQRFCHNDLFSVAVLS